MVPMPAPSDNFPANSAPVSETRYFEQLLEESLSIEPVPSPDVIPIMSALTAKICPSTFILTA